MNKQELQKRIAELDQQIILFSNSLNAIQGAKQECLMWINKIDEKEKQEANTKEQPLQEAENVCANSDLNSPVSDENIVGAA